jgi:hypothetical protein
MVADEICELLTGAGLGLDGSNLFPEAFPAHAPDTAVAVDVYSGLPSDRYQTDEQQRAALEYPLFHVFVRDERDKSGRAGALAQAIYDALDGSGGVLAGVYYHDIQSLDGPPKGPVFDDNDRPVYVLNFGATKDPS